MASNWWQRRQVLRALRVAGFDLAADKGTACALLDDTFWMAGSIGLNKIPGTENIDTTNLWFSEATWIWLLFHAAWSCPPGTVLRAYKGYPARMVAKAEWRKRVAKELGFGDQKHRLLIDDGLYKEAMSARHQKMSQEEREAEWRGVYDEIYADAPSRIESGSYWSRLPIDPFTASAALLELMIAMDDSSDRQIGQIFAADAGEENRCAPMAKSEMARRITGNRNARARGRGVP